MKMLSIVSTDYTALLFFFFFSPLLSSTSSTIHCYLFYELSYFLFCYPLLRLLVFRRYYLTFSLLQYYLNDVVRVCVYHIVYLGCRMACVGGGVRGASGSVLLIVSQQREQGAHAYAGIWHCHGTFLVVRELDVHQVRTYCSTCFSLVFRRYPLKLFL